MKREISYREKEATKSSIVGIILNTFLGFTKVSLGFFTNSLAILADGIDSVTDIMTSFLTLIASKIANKPADESHPYGHERIEPIITKILSIVIIFAGYQVLYNSLSRLFSVQVTIEKPLLIFIVSIISILIKLFLYFYKSNIGNKINSSSVIADAMNMRNDVLTSSSVAIGIFIFYLTGVAWIDSIIAIFVSIMIFKVGIEMFLETSNELMDGSKELGSIYKIIIEAADNFKCIKNPHKIRVRKSGYVYLVDLHIELEPNMTIREANEITGKYEKKIKELNNFIKDVVIHMEPYENDEIECYGLDKNKIKKFFGD
jgi:cation diffusion facilitator family transporter